MVPCRLQRGEWGRYRMYLPHWAWAEGFPHVIHPTCRKSQTKGASSLQGGSRAVGERAVTSSTIGHCYTPHWSGWDTPPCLQVRLPPQPSGTKYCSVELGLSGHTILTAKTGQKDCTVTKPESTGLKRYNASSYTMDGIKFNTNLAIIR